MKLSVSDTGLPPGDIHEVDGWAKTLHNVALALGRLA